MSTNRLLQHGDEEPSLDESDIEDAYVKAELDELEDSEAKELGDSEFERILKKRGMYGLIEKKRQPKSLRLIQFVLCLATVALGAVIGRLFFKPGNQSGYIEKSEEPDSKKLLEDFELKSEATLEEVEKAVDNAAQSSMMTQEEVNINLGRPPRRDPRTTVDRDQEKRTRQISRGQPSYFDRVNSLRSEGRSPFGWNSRDAGVRPDPRMSDGRRPRDSRFRDGRGFLDPLMRDGRRPPPEAPTPNDILNQRYRQLANERGNAFDRDLKVHERRPTQSRGRTPTVRDNYQGRPSGIPRSSVRSSRADRSSKRKTRPSARTRPERINLSSSGRG